MKTLVITECAGIPEGDYTIFDLSKRKVHRCVGCWNCWWKTPGRCAHHDLDAFYHEYISAHRVVYIAKVTKGFVSGKMKSLFDRMIPLYLPYTTYKTGESMHVKRYERYPDVAFYYDGVFDTQQGKAIFEAYIKRVFYQFYSKLIAIGPLTDWMEGRQGNDENIADKRIS